MRLRRWRREHETIDIQKQHWTFGGIFGTYDEHQLQRGFQVFREVCAGCHSARLLAFRNLEEEGGPSFSEAQVKALAAEYEVSDPDVEGGTRKALPSDNWPGTGQTDADLRAAFGIVPPDLSGESPMPVRYRRNSRTGCSTISPPIRKAARTISTRC